MSMVGGVIILVLCFLLLFPVLLMFTSMWNYARPIIDNQTLAGTNTLGLGGNQSNANVINRLGDSFFYFSSDSIIVILYFALVIAFFVSALYESARPETLPLGLLFLIPLILISCKPVAPYLPDICLCYHQ